MLRIVTSLLLLSWTTTLMAADGSVADVVLAIHGGIGVDREHMTPELEEQLRPK